MLQHLALSLFIYTHQDFTATNNSIAIYIMFATKYVLMPRRKSKIGNCHLCGEHTKLSFEHVPPRAAFNDKPIVHASIHELIKKETDLDTFSGRTYQRGAGAYTLCERCNSLTGAWYGSDFVDWTYQIANVLLKAKGDPSLFYLYKLFPLRVIKQVVCMFFSINGDKFREAQPDLVRFVLNKESRFLNSDIRIYCFFNPTARSRHSGASGVLNFETHEAKIISEVIFPPMGYVMSHDSIKPDKRLFDISFFSEYHYNDWKELGLCLPTLPIYTYLPGDYRNRKEVLRTKPK